MDDLIHGELVFWQEAGDDFFLISPEIIRHSRMQPIIRLTQRFARSPGDSDDVAISKQLIFIVSSCCSTCGLVWGALYYWFLGPGLTMFLPWLFVVIVGTAMPIAHFLKNHRILIYVELLCITWVTAFLQWSLGSLHDSSVVLVWSFLGPIGALIFLSKREAVFWMIQFLAIVLITIFIEPHLSNDSLHATDTSRMIFYVMNLCAPTLVVFFASYYFVTNLVKLKKRGAELNEELQHALEDLKRTQQQLIENEKLAAFGTAAKRLSHEIQNPLNFVMNFSSVSGELISEIESGEIPETEKQSTITLLKDNIQKIDHHSKRVSSIIAELQDHTMRGTAEDFFRKNDSFAK